MRFEEKVIKLVVVGAPNLWGHFMNGILMSCDAVYMKNRGGEVKNTC